MCTTTGKLLRPVWACIANDLATTVWAHRAMGASETTTRGSVSEFIERAPVLYLLILAMMRGGDVSSRCSSEGERGDPSPIHGRTTERSAVLYGFNVLNFWVRTLAVFPYAAVSARWANP